jgi:transposase
MKASREQAADAGSMDRQSLRDWVHAFNAHGPDGLINRLPPGRPPKLKQAQREDLRAIVAKGPDPAKDGVVRWRLSDLKGVIAARFGVSLDEVSIGRLLKKQGFAHISARPQHPERDAAQVAEFKGLSGSLCAGPVSLLSPEPFAEHDGELGLGFEPFARWPLPLFGRMVQHQI